MLFLSCHDGGRSKLSGKWCTTRSSSLQPWLGRCLSLRVRCRVLRVYRLLLFVDEGEWLAWGLKCALALRRWSAFRFNDKRRCTQNAESERALCFILPLIFLFWSLLVHTNLPLSALILLSHDNVVGVAVAEAALWLLLYYYYYSYCCYYYYYCDCKCCYFYTIPDKLNCFSCNALWSSLLLLLLNELLLNYLLDLLYFAKF